MRIMLGVVKNMYFKAFCVSLLILGIGSMAQAALYDRGGGMIYDDVLDITWLRDANYAQTSGYDSDGFMTWGQAMTWAEELNYGGYSDWRLPSALNQDGSGPCVGGPVVGLSTDDTPCVASEMGHMFFTNLGVEEGTSITSSTNANLSLFTNLVSDDSVYWTSTEKLDCYSPGGCAWVFWMDYGDQFFLRTGDLSGDPPLVGKAWAVRDGDVTPVQTPPVVIDTAVVNCDEETVTIEGSGFGGDVNAASTKVTAIDDAKQCAILSWTDTTIVADCGYDFAGLIRVDNAFSGATFEVEGCGVWDWWESWSWSRR